jgi:hypothetical protein
MTIDSIEFSAAPDTFVMYLIANLHVGITAKKKESPIATVQQNDKPRRGMLV